MNPQLRILISAGEVSGDLYAAQLVRALRQVAGPGVRLSIKALAGPLTRRAGAELLADSCGRGALGFVEPLRHLPFSLTAALRIRRQVLDWRPQAVVLLDYPGFNIPLSGLLRRWGDGPVIYYLPPEECLWGRKGSRRVDRAAQVVRNCDCLLTSHATDTAFYAAEGGRVERIRHPLLTLVDAQPSATGQRRSAGNSVALLPASRRQELDLLWPALEQTAARMVRARPELRFVLPLAGLHLRSAVQQAVAGTQARHPALRGRIELLQATPEQPQSALTAARRADVALSKSGSVTLELALAGVPHLLLFRIDRVTEWLGRRVLRLSEADFPHMALPSFILGRTLVPEFKQHAVDPAAMAATALELLDAGSPARKAQLAGFAQLRAVLGQDIAAERAAEVILHLAASAT